jgi:methylated-DNA-[protein]-cysteine S-methyltransferase
MAAKATVYWATLVHDAWQFHLAATERGLCRITLPNETLKDLQQWVNRRIPGAVLQEDSARLTPYTEQLREYLRGVRREFSIPLDLRGTEFQQQVWRQLARIPYGTTCSYADLAAAIGRPKAVRAVGLANGANPLPIVLPCHRVIGRNGQLTGYGGGLDMKAALLRLEGVSCGP